MNRSLFLSLLDILYDSGYKNSGSSFEPYPSLRASIKNAGIDVSDKLFDDFLTICALLKIIQIKGKNERKLLKDYQKAKMLLSALG